MHDDPENRSILAHDLHVAVTGKMVEALVKSENEMRMRLDLLKEIVWEVGPGLDLLFISRAWKDVAGEKIESVKGKPFIDLFDPVHHAELRAAFAQTERGLHHDPLTLPLRRRDGQERWVECTMTRSSSDGWIGTLRDITETKRHLEQVQLLSLVANHTDNFVIITDASGRTRWVNRSFTDFTGYSIADLVDRPPGKVLQGPKTDPDEVRRIAHLIRSGQSVKSEILNYTRDGRPYWTTMHITPIHDAEGGIESYISVQSDTTAMHELNAQLEREKHRAESANEAKSHFLSNISHEIRTPLNAVIGFLSILERTDLKGDQRSYIARMDTAAKHLLGLINDVLDFSKIEAKMMKLETSAFDPQKLVSDIAAMMFAECEQKSVSFFTSFEVEPDLRVVGDEAKLRQVLLNLANNAVKFTDQGHVHLFVREVARDAEEVTLHFAVNDTGIGIGEENIDRIFSAFAQADGAANRRFGGTGLGLSISQRMVELMGGSITVKSRPGEGSTFAFALSFPISSVAANSAPEPAGDPGKGGHAGLAKPMPLSGLTILLVDDNEFNRIIGNEILLSRGARVICVDSGQKAIDEVGRRNGKVDVILMDMQMPGMDGIEASRQILAGYQHIPVFSMTANSNVVDLERALNAGIRQHIGKPFRADDLVKLILELELRPLDE